MLSNKLFRAVTIAILFVAFWGLGIVDTQINKQINSITANNAINLAKLNQARQKLLEMEKQVEVNANAIKKLTVTATAYLCVDYREGRGPHKHVSDKPIRFTKSGDICKPGVTLAVDPRVIPLGSKVYIPSLGKTFIASDTGNAIKGLIVDIAVTNRADAMKWGRRRVEVVLKNDA